MTHRRYYKCGGITIQVDSDLPITDSTFHPKFKLFEVKGPEEDTIFIRHHFSLPDIRDWDLGEEIYRRPPWAIYKRDSSWLYLGIPTTAENNPLHRVAVFNNDHTIAEIHNPHKVAFLKGYLHALTLFPTDQILLAQVLADRKGCYLHSSGVILNGKGVLFAGHSQAGKSTIVTLLKDQAEILCDDRMIVRRWEDGFRIHGNWSHGDIPKVSSSSAPLAAIMFLEQSSQNCLILMDNKREIVQKLLAFLIKPLVTADWWEKMLTLVEKMARVVPCYTLQFNKSLKVIDILEDLLSVQRSELNDKT
jgi:hypothetical protein